MAIGAPNMEIIAQGAEAKIYRSKKGIVKNRVKKGYRLSKLDFKLRKSRTKREAKLISAARRLGVPVPDVLDIDDKKMILVLSEIKGEKVRDWIEHKNSKEIKDVMGQIGQLTKKLHKGGLIHGDLTTSNLILKNKVVFFIDFGLGQVSNRIEDKAVDIHLFKECLRSKHYTHWKSYWTAFKSRYKDKEVLHRMDLIESRARYKKVS